MRTPQFYEDAPVIRVRDPLAHILGAAEDGVLEYKYIDAVRLAGHSCPTVAGAFLMARAALAKLYADMLPERGAVEVSMAMPEDSGTTGVVQQIFTLITGAAALNGFHGIGGRFVRAHLLQFGENPAAEYIATFRRSATGAAVRVALDTSGVSGSPQLRPLMTRALAHNASKDDILEFGKLWQDRVRRMLTEHADDPHVIAVEAL